MNTTQPPPDEELKTVQEATRLVAFHANGEGFTPGAVEKLARFFLKNKFQVWAGIAGLVQNYWVGYGDSHPGMVCFQPENVWVLGGRNQGRAKITAYVVPTTKLPAPEPIFEPRGPTPDQWTSVDFTANPATAPKVVMTSKLSGCTLAVAAAGGTFYMGHWQPTDPPENGAALARRLFWSCRWEGLPRGVQPRPESMLIIRPGDPPTSGNPEIPTLFYGKRATVLGLLVKSGPAPTAYELAFIVTKQTVENHIVSVHRVTCRGANREWEMEDVK